MKLLEADRSATVAWSPVPGHASYIASGTVAGTMGIDFDTSAHLEIFSVDLNGSANKQMKVVGKTSTSERFHKLCWGLTGTQQGTFSMGLVAGGLASGVIQVWNPSKIIAQEEDCLVATCERHEGPVQGLDFNPFQHNLLASGGSDSEVFIWDLSNASAPTCYNPGSKTHGQQEAAITCVAWNRKVQRILGSTNHNGVTTLWDLKAKRAVLSFHDPNKKIRCRTMAWNPDEETQLITASEDDNAPVIAVWDLRNTYSPVKELVGHTKGVWSISWCPSDSDLFLSSGKDNKTFCWNLKTSELLCEVDPASQTWNFEVQWSPRIPAILSTCSLEGKINIYSMQDVRNEQPSTLGLSVSPKTVSHPPKWLKRPVGAAFGFGGKLAYFKKHKANEKPSVQIKQVSSDADVLARASSLEKALDGGVAQLVEYCNSKLESDSEEDKSTWKLLKSLFEDNQRTQIHHFLGYNSQTMQKSIQELLTKLGKKPDTNNNDSPVDATADETSEKKDSDVSELFPNGEQEKEQESEGTIFDSFAQTLQSQLPSKPSKVSKNVIKFPKEQNTEEGLITQALLMGNFEGAVDICVQTQRWGDAFILAAYSGTELFKKTQEVYFASKQAPYLSVMSCIVKDELRELVEQGELSEWKAILAILATYAKAEDFALLVGILGDRLHSEANDGNAATLCYICAGHLDKTVAIWSAPSKKATSSAVDVHSLQSLIEKIAVFRKAINHKQPLSPVVLQQYSEYALILASQGQVRNALTYLSPLLDTKPQDVTSSENLGGYILLDRVFHSQKNPPSQLAPPFPFKKEEIRTPFAAAPAPGRHPAPAPGLVPGRQPPAVAPSPFPTPARTVSGVAPVPAPSAPAPYIPPQPSLRPHSVPAPTTAPAPTMAPVPTPALPTPAGPTYRPPTMPTPTPILPTPTAHPTYQPHPTPTLPTPTAHPPFHPPTPTAAPLQTMPPMVPSAPKQTAPPVGPPPTGFAPPPATSTPPVGPPPAMSSPPVGPPPTGAAPSGKTTKAEPAPVVSTALAADIEFVVKSLQSTFEACSKSSDPKISKLSKDVTKRFEPLIEKMSKNQVSGPVVQLLVQLCTAINNGDSRTAQSLNVTLSQDHWEELGSTLLIGFKRLIEMTKN